MEEQRNDEILRRFALIKNRQHIAIALAVCSVIVLAVMGKRPDLFFHLTRLMAFKIEAFVILLFVNFTAFNWRCPSCKKYLGHDMGRKKCRKCGTRLQ